MQVVKDIITGQYIWCGTEAGLPVYSTGAMKITATQRILITTEAIAAWRETLLQS
jgi:hypothetical protein